MRLIFAGTPEFAREALAQLHAAGHEIALVLTQPDRPAGRGMKLQASPVKQWAQSHALAVSQPRSLRLEGKYPEDAREAQAALQAAQADAMVVAAYGLILPQWVLDLPRHGCLNIHASLLPRWRGAAPIHRAIEAGDTHTGITLMQMDAGLDTGDMLAVHTEPILARDTTASLHDRLAVAGGALMVQALKNLEGLRRTPQPAEGVTYAHKIEKHEATLDWSQAAITLDRRIRAFHPFPGAHSALNGEVLKIGAAEVLPHAKSSAACGTLVHVGPEGLDVATGEGVLRLTQLQRPGGKRLSAAEFLRGQPLDAGMCFDVPAA
jgi:methionyl-tRNA formyltransferase